MMLSTQPTEFRPKPRVPPQPQRWAPPPNLCLYIWPLSRSASGCLSAPTCSDGPPLGLCTCCSPCLCAGPFPNKVISPQRPSVPLCTTHVPSPVTSSSPSPSWETGRAWRFGVTLAPPRALPSKSGGTHLGVCCHLVAPRGEAAALPVNPAPGRLTRTQGSPESPRVGGITSPPHSLRPERVRGSQRAGCRV